PHAPIHRLGCDGIYIVTAATLHRKRLFASEEKLTILENSLLTLAKTYQWQLEAWSVFMNHYHLIARGNSDAAILDSYIKHAHAETARILNTLDHAEGRQVWFNYWETRLTFERSYLTRLNYVHQNAVKHGLVSVANQYEWCSAAWFERTASAAAVKTI